MLFRAGDTASAGVGAQVVKEYRRAPRQPRPEPLREPKRARNHQAALTSDNFEPSGPEGDMAKPKLYSTVPKNDSWTASWGKGEKAKLFFEVYDQAKKPIMAIRDAQAKALADDQLISGREMEDIFVAARTAAAEVAAQKRAALEGRGEIKKLVDQVGETLPLGEDKAKVEIDVNKLVEKAVDNELLNVSTRGALAPEALAALSRHQVDWQPQAPVEPKVVASGDSAYDGVILGDGVVLDAGSPPQALKPVRPVDATGKALPPKTNEVFIQVNGMNSNKAMHDDVLRQLANQAQAEVSGIHNATSGAPVDLIQCLTDKLFFVTNPAVATLSTLTYELLKAGKTPHLVVHSQGGLVARRALIDLYHRISESLRPTHPDPVELHKAVRAELAKVKVETFGAAAHEYPDGPQYVHYLNTWDAVSSQAGLGWTENPQANWMVHPGEGARVIYFINSGVDGELEWGGVDWKYAKKMLNYVAITPTHDFLGVYLPARIDFDDARAGKGLEPYPGTEPAQPRKPIHRPGRDADPRGRTGRKPRQH